MVAVQQKGDTGQGAILTIASVTFAARIKKINGNEVTLDALNVSALVDTGFEKWIPSDLKKVNHLVIDFYWDTLIAFPTLGDESSTLVIVFPLRTSETAITGNAAIGANGFVVGYKSPDLELGGVQMGQLTWCWDGTPGLEFTYTVSS